MCTHDKWCENEVENYKGIKEWCGLHHGPRIKEKHVTKREIKFLGEGPRVPKDKSHKLWSIAQVPSWVEYLMEIWLSLLEMKWRVISYYSTLTYTCPLHLNEFSSSRIVWDSLEEFDLPLGKFEMHGLALGLPPIFFGIINIFPWD